MTRRPLTDILLCGVSPWALEIGVRSRAACKSDNGFAASNFLGRIKLWLELIFGGLFGQDVTVRGSVQIDDVASNRHKTRLRRRKLPLARRPDPLSQHIYRRYGHTRFLDWIYNRRLTPRIAWCFRDWNWRWASRANFAACVGYAQIIAECGAPLRPD